jgi:hypothetical protein
MTKYTTLNLLLAAGILAAAPLLSTPAIAQDTQAPKAKEADKLPTPREVVDRFIKVTGGMEAYKAHAYRTSKGYFEMPAMGMRGEMVIHQAQPNLMIASIDIPQMGSMKTGFNGTTGWSTNPMQGPMIMKGKQLEQVKREADFFGSVDILKNFKEARTVGIAEFNGEKCYQLKLTDDTGITNVYYSVKTGLAVGRKAVEISPMGEVPSVMTISAYKEYGGVLVPTMQTVEAMGQTQNMVTETVTFEELDPSIFELPAEIKTLVKAQKKADEAKTEDVPKGEEPKKDAGKSGS